MPTDILSATDARRAPPAAAVVRSAPERLRAVAVALGIVWSIAFVIVGLGYGLQMYGDGSIFSYAIAVRDLWDFHWHNLSGRLFVHLATHVPAELYVGLTGSPRGGIVVFGLLFFAAPLLGLVATWAADRSRNRIFFRYACASTACACPLVFGFVTEMWIAHALFWPALAVCHYARRTISGPLLVFALLLALAFTHEAAMVMAVAILGTLALRGLRDPAFVRAAGCFAVITAIWIAVKVFYPPSFYYVEVFDAAALHFFDLARLASDPFLRLFVGALAGYGLIFVLVRRFAPEKAHLWAAMIVAAALAAYWLWFDHALHTYFRYFLRTVLFAATIGFGGLAALYMLQDEGRLDPPIWMPFVPRMLAALAGDTMARAAVGAMLIASLVHAVETAKFVDLWMQYTAAVRALAMGSASDPALGDPRFVSAARIDPRFNPITWNSTTPYLSAILAPGFAPARLVVDPRANYFWLTCETVRANEAASLAVPVETRRLLRVHACLHR